MQRLDGIDQQKLLDGDPATQREFIEALQPLALGIAAGRYRLPPDQAEDILLEVARKLWHNDLAALRDWRGEGSLTSYLKMIIHRFCLMHLRKLRKRDAEVSVETLEIFPGAAADDPVAQDELVGICQASLTDLPTRDQQLIRLRYFEEQDYTEIQEQLGLSYGAARKALHTALRRLREQMRARAPDLFPTKIKRI